MMAAVTKPHVQFSDHNDQSDFKEGRYEEKNCGDDNGEKDESNVSTGWAEAMAKILGKKTPESKSGILMRNGHLNKMKENERQEQLQRKKQVDKRRAWEMMCRKKPDILKDRETEKALQKIATRGVVQLFNAVKKHQKTMANKMQEVSGSERKKAKILSSVSRKDFINVLRRNEGVNGDCSISGKDTVAEATEKPAWSVLTDDFMMGANMKDWDKDSDREELDPHVGED